MDITRPFNGWNCIGGTMVDMLASSPVEGWLEPRSGQSKDYMK
jgi:hypothetical protein